MAPEIYMSPVQYPSPHYVINNIKKTVRVSNTHRSVSRLGYPDPVIFVSSARYPCSYFVEVCVLETPTSCSDIV